MTLTVPPAILSEPSTDTSANYERDKKLLQDEIQRTFNRIQYDRSEAVHIPGLKKKLAEQEAEYKQFFGGEEV